MLQRDRDGESSSQLITFRLSVPVQLLAPGEEMSAERIADHRREYLRYEGPIPGNRGSIRRLVSGRLARIAADPDRWRLEVEWDATDEAAPVRQSLEVRRAEGATWRVVCISREATRGRPGPTPKG